MYWGKTFLATFFISALWVFTGMLQTLLTVSVIQLPSNVGILVSVVAWGRLFVCVIGTMIILRLSFRSLFNIAKEKRKRQLSDASDTEEPMNNLEAIEKDPLRSKLT
jgi:hypothetical protein